jgi:hypothetical protein
VTLSIFFEPAKENPKEALLLQRSLAGHQLSSVGQLVYRLAENAK